jgi:hypothetical protein
MMQRIKDLGADTVRVTITQGGFDESSIEYDADYLNFIKNKVGMARLLGLNVVITVRKKISNCVNNSDMPDEGTRKAWSAIIPHFASDRGVMFELLNEPFNSESSLDAATNVLRLPLPDEQFREWQTTFNELIKLVRTPINGVVPQNTIIVEGLAAGKIFNLNFKLSDPLNNLIHGVHVYFNAKFPFGKIDSWDQAFGNFCRSSNTPCFVTEWQDSGPFSAEAKNPNTTGCMPGVNPQSFIDYVVKNKWGLGAWGFDYPNTVMLQDGSRLTKYNSENPEWLRCDKTVGWGNGEAVFNAYNSPAWGG